MKSSHLPAHPRRGSALVTTMMLSMALMIIIASILTYSLSERRLNYREAMRLEARNAAEAVAEYGMAQVHDIMQNRYDMSPTRFTASEGTIVMPPASFWSGGHVATSGANVPELIIGTVVPVLQNGNSLYYFSSADPDNANDPLKGCYAFRFDVKVIAKATVTADASGAGGTQSCYMQETLSARASPLFSRAIFYNMDLEIAPGPAMNILGATHTNGNLWVMKQSSNSTALNFVGPVTVAKNLYADVKIALTTPAGASDNLSSYTDNVFFSTAAGGLVGLKGVPPSGGSAIWRDQKWGNATENATTDANFRQWSSQTYGGNLQTILHGVSAQVPPGISTYVEDPTPANGQDNSINKAHQMIEPPLTSLVDGSAYDSDVEAQKFSRKAGIYICANPTSSARDGRMPDGTVINIPARSYRVFAHVFYPAESVTEIILPGQPTYGANNATANTGSNRPAAVDAALQFPIVTIRANEMFDMRRSTYNYRSPPRSAANPYTLKNISTIDLDMTALKLAVDYSVSSMTSSQVYYTKVPPNGTATSAAAWTGFIYNNTTGTGASALPAATSLGAVNSITNLPAGAWNGAVYIESVDAHQPAVQSDFVTANPKYRNGAPTLIGGTPVNEPSGVRLINGRGHLATGGSNPGLTVATNDAVYVLGHYNANGAIDTTTTVGNTTNSGRFSDDTSEQACAICCDAFTVLSTPYYTNNGTTVSQRNGWNDALSSLRRANSTTWSVNWATTAPSNSNDDDGFATSTQPRRYPYSMANVDAVYNATHDPIASPTFGGSISYGTATTIRYLAADVEISAAIMAGIVISNKDNNGQSSGSANNYPRFIEEWANDGTAYQNLGLAQRIVAIRGSIVAMYESRAATEPWSWRTMNAPNRLWGFHNLFATGHFPPLTPIVMDYRRINFNDIDRPTYNSLKSAWGL